MPSEQIKSEQNPVLLGQEPMPLVPETLDARYVVVLGEPADLGERFASWVRDRRTTIV